LVEFFSGYRCVDSGKDDSVAMRRFMEAMCDLFAGYMVFVLVRGSTCLYKFIIKITDIIRPHSHKYRIDIRSAGAKDSWRCREIVKDEGCYFVLNPCI
jgi:hypothetical protein